MVKVLMELRDGQYILHDDDKVYFHPAQWLCPVCHSSRTRYRFRTKDHVCERCSNIYEPPEPKYLCDGDKWNPNAIKA